MDSYKTYLATVKLSDSWLEEQDEDIYEVESRVPLPHPFPLCEHLDENNSVIINTSIFHIIHKRNGHILKLISKISLPTPPYSVSIKIWFFYSFMLSVFYIFSEKSSRCCYGTY